MNGTNSSLLLALRTRTVQRIRSDFGEMLSSKQCPLKGCREEDSLPHTLVCQVLIAAVQEPSVVKYWGVFSDIVAREWILDSKDT